MKRWILMCLMMVSSVCMANSFQAAESLFQAGKVQDAISLYERAQGPKTYSWVYWYNLGTLYGHADQVGKGLRALYAAEKRNPGQRDVRRNIALLEEKVSGHIHARVTVVSIFERMVHCFSLFQWAMGLAIGLMGLNLSLGFGYWKSRLRRVGRFFSMGFGVGAFVSIWMVLASLVLTTDKGVVMVSKTALFSGPSESLTVLFYVHEGQRVDVLQSALAYTKVRCPNGVEGWVRGHDLSLIP